MSLSAEASCVLDLCARIAAHSDVPPPGITRLFLSPATREVHALLTAEMQSLGMSVRTDSIGNLRGLYPASASNPCSIHRSTLAMSGSTNPEPVPEGVTPTLLLGSHIDTVPDAGAYDGILGVACALALIRALEGRRLPYAIEIIAFSEEEGIRFKFPFIGSRALAGTLAPKELERRDEDGISVAEALRSYGLEPSGGPGAPGLAPETWGFSDCAPTPGTFAFLELHIEQGPVLESLGIPLAVVTEIVGQTRYQITLFGQANHAGTTPMYLRRDALAAAAEFIVSVERFATQQDSLVATVGLLEAAPGAANIIPGMATLTLDVRHADDATRFAACDDLLAEAQAIATRRHLRFHAHKRCEQASVATDPGLRRLLSQSVAATGHAVHAMPSGAGHDAMIVAGILPAAMLFLRTPGGLSHHPEESVSPEDIEAALAACLHFLLHLDPATITPQTTS